MRKLIASDSPWEAAVGFSRAVRVGNQVFVSGTVGAGPDGKAVGESAHEQAVRALQRIEIALNQAGAELKDVVRTRIYVTDILQWEEVARAHSSFFGSIRPATSMVEVSKLIAPDLSVEIEADAVVE